jgi:hypothetical protein
MAGSTPPQHTIWSGCTSAQLVCELILSANCTHLSWFLLRNVQATMGRAGIVEWHRQIRVDQRQPILYRQRNCYKCS